MTQKARSAWLLIVDESAAKTVRPRRTMPHRGWTLAALLLGITMLPSLARADAVVGNGTDTSCTDAALDAALAVGGVITFDCGDPFTVTILLDTPKTITGTVVLHMDGNITLHGRGTLRPFTVAAGGSLTLEGISVIAGHAVDGGCIHNS